MARFTVHVVPRSTRSAAAGWHGGLPRLRLKSPPADGRANGEAERLLSDLLGTTVRLVGGAQSRRKIFEADLSATEIVARIADVFGTH